LVLYNRLIDQLFTQIRAQDVDRFVSGHESEFLMGNTASGVCLGFLNNGFMLMNAAVPKARLYNSRPDRR
jgi:hypothetical protein